MLLLRVTVSILVTIYLIFQAETDAKTGMVSWWLNTVMLCFTFLLWAMTTSFCLPSSYLLSTWIEMVLLMVVLYISTLNVPIIKKVMQPADAKAFATIYFASSFIMSISFAPIVLVMTLLISHSSFIVWHRVIKKDSKGERKPYFPFILFGFVLVELLYFVLFFFLQ